MIKERLKTCHWLRSWAAKKKKRSLQPQRRAAIKAHCAEPCAPKRLLQRLRANRAACRTTTKLISFVRVRRGNLDKTGSRKTVPNWRALLWGIVFYTFYHPFFIHLKKQFRCTAELQGEWSLKRSFCWKLGLTVRMPALSDLIRLKQSQLI